MEYFSCESREDARQKILTVGMKAKKFAAKHNLYCYTVCRDDKMIHNLVSSMTVYTDDYFEINRLIENEIEYMNNAGIKYHIFNNFKFPAWEDNGILDSLDYSKNTDKKIFGETNFTKAEVI